MTEPHPPLGEPDDTLRKSAPRKRKGKSASPSPESLVRDSAGLLDGLPEETSRLFREGGREFEWLSRPGAREVFLAVEGAGLKRARIDHELEEKGKENDARRSRERDHHRQEMLERRILFLVSIVLVCLAAAFCVGVLIGSTDADLRSWAKAILNTLITGVAAFSIGRNRRPSRAKGVDRGR